MDRNIPKRSKHGISDKEVSLKSLRTAYLQAAKIVSIYGDKYLPIFERLEKEYVERNKKRDILQRALNIADENPI